jgi:hypothetical protein
MKTNQRHTESNVTKHSGQNVKDSPESDDLIDLDASLLTLIGGGTGTPSTDTVGHRM